MSAVRDFCALYKCGSCMYCALIGDLTTLYKHSARYVCIYYAPMMQHEALRAMLLGVEGCSIAS